MLCRNSGTGSVALVARRVVPSRGVVDGARDQIPATRDLDASRIDVHGLWRAGHLFHVRPPTTGGRASQRVTSFRCSRVREGRDKMLLREST
jgi:hypothetical protein